MFSLSALLLVVLGGAIGVAARAALTLPFGADAHPLVLPALTLAVNVTGSLLLGILVGVLNGRMPHVRAFAGTGVLGGFTTYSAFSVHVVTTAGAAPVVGLALAAVSVFAGALAAAAGMRLGEHGRGPGRAELTEGAP